MLLTTKDGFHLPSGHFGSMTFAQIILPLNLKGTFTYRIPEDLQANIQVGMRVLVPFGGKKIYTGIVLEFHDNEPDTFQPKEIISLLDDVPILPTESLQFWSWLSSHYLSNIGEVYRFAFPSSMKLESETFLKLKPDISIDYEILDANELFLIQALEVRQIINLKDIEAFVPKKEIIKTVNSLIDLKFIEIDEKVQEKYKSMEVKYLQLNPEILKNDQLSEVFKFLKKSPKQNALLLQILGIYSEDTTKPIRKSDVFENGSFTASHLKGLIEKNLVQEYVLNEDRVNLYEGETEAAEQLTEIQLIAKNRIDKAFNEGQNVLLHGVTSSGKTHVYLKLMEEMTDQGKMVLVLLPEISLTKQIIGRLEKKYGSQLGFYHQKMTDFEKVEIWKKVRQNELSVIIGTRNALFLPYQNLGLIVVDEEHDQAYKPRESSPYFHGRDAALYLALVYKANVILSSATPSVESYFLAKSGKLSYVPLEKRFQDIALPKLELVDFKKALDTKNAIGNFSTDVLAQMNLLLEEHNQIMILHNKRGYSNVVECESCGYVTYCSNCDVVMTYHKFSNEMKCHYCGHRAAKPIACPKCHSTNLNEKGIGVEQIHEEVSKLFPNSEVDRMDVDSMRRKFAYEKLFEKMDSGETDILVGTQMISKGLDFDHIELVAIPRADQMLYVQDFRAEERAYQLITQVAGRAGRTSGQGKVMIQTFSPEHSIFQLLKQENPEAIYTYFLEERKKFNYPPFTRLVMLELKHRKEDKVHRATTFMGSILRKYLHEAMVLGPEKAPISRLNTYYQYQILLKFPRGKTYQQCKELLAISLDEFDEIPAYQSIKKSIFVDF